MHTRSQKNRQIGRVVNELVTAALLQAATERREQRRKSSGHRATVPAPFEHEYDDVNGDVHEEDEEEEARARVSHVVRGSLVSFWGCFATRGSWAVKQKEPAIYTACGATTVW